MFFINSDHYYQGINSVRKYIWFENGIEYHINNNIKSTDANTYINRILNYQLLYFLSFWWLSDIKSIVILFVFINVSIL